MSTSHTATSLRAAIYTRMTTLDQKDSPERQLGQTEPLCKRFRYEVVTRYADLGHHGADDDRPEFQQMLRDAAAGKFDIIVIDEPSRLSRSDPLDFAAVVAKPLRDAGVKVHPASTGVVTDWDDIAHFIMSAVTQHTSNKEVVTASRRMVTKLAAKVANADYVNAVPYGLEVHWVGPDGEVRHRGKANWMRRPEGYTPKLVAGDPEKVKVVKWVFEAYVERDMSLRGIATELNARGVSPPKGKEWTGSFIRFMLKNRKYVGDFVFNQKTGGRWHRLTTDAQTGTGVPLAKPRKPDPKDRRSSWKGPVPNPECDWVIRENVYEALIDREVFQKAQARLVANRERKTTPERRDTSLLSRLLICAHCGFRFNAVWGRSTSKARGKYRTYRCGGYSTHGQKVCKPYRVVEEWLLNLVIRVIDEHFTPARRARLQAEVARRAKTTNQSDDLASRQKRLDKLSKQIQQGTMNLMSVEDAGLFRDMEKALKELRAQRDVLAAELGVARSARPVEEADRAVAFLAGRPWTLRDALQLQDSRQVRLAIMECVETIELKFESVPWGSGKRSRYVPGAGSSLTLTSKTVLGLKMSREAPE